MRRVFHSSRILKIRLLGICFMIAGLGTRLVAQATYTAQPTAVVTDASGGVVPGAKVTLTDEETNVGQTFLTDGRGIFVFTGIRPAAYTIRVAAAGFSSHERNGIVTNTERFAFPDLGVGSATFGQVTSSSNGSTPRHSQFGLRFQF
jgi:hypothetical protein